MLKTLRTKKVLWESVMKYGMMLSIILSGSTMYGVLEPFNNHGIISYTFHQISLIMTGLVVLYMMIKHPVRPKNIKLFLMVLVYLSIYLLISRYRISSALESMCLPVLLYIGLTCFQKSDALFVDLFNKYSNIVFIMACISLFFYIFGVLLCIIPFTQLRYTNHGVWYNCYNYFYLHFVNEWQTTDIAGRTIYRNIGIFMEGPGFAGILLFAFWWELFGHCKQNWRRIVILLICLATTLTTKAYVFSTVLVFVFLYSKKSYQFKFWRKIRNILFPFVLLITFVVILYVMKVKIQTVGELGATSWTIRVADYYMALKAWLTHPVFGVGFYNLERLYVFMPTSFLKGNPTAGILNILAYGGIYMFIGNIYALSRYYIRFRKTPYFSTAISFLLLVFMLLFTSAMQYDYLYLLILSLGLTLPKRPFLEIGEKRIALQNSTIRNHFCINNS